MGHHIMMEYIQFYSCEDKTPTQSFITEPQFYLGINEAIHAHLVILPLILLKEHCFL